jgi:hypothetical protein
VELHPLPLPDLAHLMQQGEARRIRHGPMTIGEVLERARGEMDAEDELERQSADPVLWARARRPRTLLNRLLGRC